MKITTLLFFFTVIIGLSGCVRDLDFDDTPKIKFEKVTFRKVGDINQPDSLTVSVSFEDGDGNLGLNSQITLQPYNSLNFFTDQATGEIITLDFIDRPGYEDLPDYGFPEGCGHWLDEETSLEDFLELAGLSFTSAETTDFVERVKLDLRTIPGEGQFLSDTLYFEANPDFENIFIDFLILDENGSDYVDEDGRKYRLFNWLTDGPNNSNQCGIDLRLRFPVLSEINDDSPVEGTLNYTLANRFIELTFGNLEMKLRVQIQDRDLNKSNIVYSELFTLRDIQVN